MHTGVSYKIQFSAGGGQHFFTRRPVDHIADFSRIGIFSLKIEGRMKRAEYVDTVVIAYRKLLNSSFMEPSRKQFKTIASEFSAGQKLAGTSIFNHKAGLK